LGPPASAGDQPGRSGYLLKSSASVEVFTAIEQVLAGKTYVTPLVTKACLSVIGAAGPLRFVVSEAAAAIPPEKARWINLRVR
jgi:DNA-binding NarL/FixJ family response regulator